MGDFNFDRKERATTGVWRESSKMGAKGAPFWPVYDWNFCLILRAPATFQLAS